MANVGLYRSNRSNMIAGVMGGIAERFGLNANLLRLIFVHCFRDECCLSRHFGVFGIVVGNP